MFRIMVQPSSLGLQTVVPRVGKLLLRGALAQLFRDPQDRS